VVNGLQKSLVAALRLCGTRFAVERAGGLEPGRPALFVSNHQSMFDIPILGAILAPHYLKFVSKRELARRWIPSISYNLRRGGNALIDRGDRAEAVEAIRKLGVEEVGGRGVSAVIFPEGTRARGGVLGPFRPQGTFALMAAVPDAPVVPVAIDSSWRLLEHGLRPAPFGTRVRVFIGAPIERSPGEDAGAIVAAAQRQIQDALARWREPDSGARKGVPLRGVTALAVAFGLGATLASAWRASETPDEPVHLEWSRRLLLERVTERRSNEYFESKSPISMLNVAARRAARRAVAGIEEPRRGCLLRFASRLPTAMLFVALLAAVFLAARAWVSLRAAHLATIACALDPNLIAHASLATVDVAFALFHFLALIAAFTFASRPSPRRGSALGVALGMAFATKFSAVLLVPAVALALIAVHEEWRQDDFVRRTAAGLFVAGAVATVTIAAAYLFVGVGAHMADLRWDSAPFTRLAGHWPDLRLPFPADFLTGIDLSLARERNLKWRVVMLGSQYPRGVWYYFGLLWLMKTPVLILAAECVGGVLAIRRGLLRRSPPLQFLAANLALLLAYFSLLFHAQIGYRFVLMCVPLGYIMAAAGLSTLADRPVWRWIGALVVVVSLLENAAYVGNHISFTNVAVQPKRRVFRWITHSNIDWRQNEDRADLYLARAGIGRDRLDPPHVLPGQNLLRHYHAAGNLRFERYRWVRENVDPVAHFDHTFLLFDLSPADFERYLETERVLEPTALSHRLCETGVPGRPVAPGETFRLPDAEGGLAWVLCVQAAGPADFVVHVDSGNMVHGPVDRPGGAHEYAEATQEIWFRLRPGPHAFSVVPESGFGAHWRAAQGNVDVTLEPPGN